MNTAADDVAVGVRKPARIDAIPNLAFEQPAGNDRLMPQGACWIAILSQKVCERIDPLDLAADLARCHRVSSRVFAPAIPFHVIAAV